MKDIIENFVPGSVYKISDKFYGRPTIGFFKQNPQDVARKRTKTIYPGDVFVVIECKPLDPHAYDTEISDNKICLKIIHQNEIGHIILFADELVSVQTT